MAQGILWQLATGFDPLGQFSRGMDQAQKRQTILEQLAGQREDRQFARDRDIRDFQFRTQESERNQNNWQQQFAQNAQNQNMMRALQQQQLELQRQQFMRGEIPAGFERDPNNPNALRPKIGGPQDPNYLRAVTEAKPKKPVPFGVQNAEAEDLDSINSLNTINSELGRFNKQIADGKLQLGPVNNLIARGRNIAGASDENSRNFQSFMATLERLRNESLRLNKGVQTEGDAQRAWNELVANINDPKVVQQRLNEIANLNNRAANFKRNMVVQRREDNQLPPPNFDRVLGVQPQNNDPISQARAAIAAGADRNAVIQRLQQNGINPQDL